MRGEARKERWANEKQRTNRRTNQWTSERTSERASEQASSLTVTTKIRQMEWYEHSQTFKNEKRIFENIYEHLRAKRAKNDERATDRPNEIHVWPTKSISWQKNIFFEEKIHFGTEKFHFCQKSHLFVEKSIFGPENNNFHKKIMLGKNPFVCRIIHFLTERSIFEQKSISWQKFMFFIGKSIVWRKTILIFSIGKLMF